MFYAILSDIHSNLEALDVVLSKCRELNVERYFCLGDIVGYNADPSECIKRIRELKECTVVRGNHDEIIGRGIVPCSKINMLARDAMLWSISRLSVDEKDWLVSNPFKVVEKELDLTVVHSCLIAPERWIYILDAEDASVYLAMQETQLCFFGHTHVPVIYENIPGIPKCKSREFYSKMHSAANTKSEELTMAINPMRKYLINPGSVGQPRNHDNRASFMIYDSENKIIRHVLVRYDISTAQDKILSSGLPGRLARRLEFGY